MSGQNIKLLPISSYLQIEPIVFVSQLAVRPLFVSKAYEVDICYVV